MHNVLRLDISVVHKISSDKSDISQMPLRGPKSGWNLMVIRVKKDVSLVDAWLLLETEVFRTGADIIDKN